MDQRITNTIHPHPFITRRGRQVIVRQATPADTALLAELLSRLSERTRWLRYASPHPLWGEAAQREAARMAQARPPQQITLVAIMQGYSGEEAVAIAELVRDFENPAAGEVAFLVRDDEQRNGIGVALASRLVQLARAAGITALRAEIQGENWAMQRLVRRLGLPFTATFSGGEAQLLLRVPAGGADLV
jgi:RimJ/RimL family protein N-acetyltransferase